jgi:hypothetical protein
MSLVVGAGVGVAMMYLLDPAEGLRRRQRIERAARDRLARAGSMASSGLEHLHEAVDRAAHIPGVQEIAARAADAAKGIYNEIGAQAGAVASDYQNQASDAAQGLRSRLSGKIDELRGRANDLSDTATSRYRKWLNRSSLALGREEDHHYVGQTACALSSLALGAGVVYLMDPENGQKRRALIADRTTYALRETGEFFRKVGRRLVSRGRDVAGQVVDRAAESVSNLRSDAAEDHPANESTEVSMGT